MATDHNELPGSFDLRSRLPRRWRLSVGAALASLALAAGCSPQSGDGGGPDSPPLHPAMSNPPSHQGSVAGLQGAGEMGNLPAGHPPIPDRSGAPPMAPPVAPRVGGAPPAAAGGRTTRDVLGTLGLEAKVPEGWVDDPTPRQFRLATLVLPRAEGDAQDAEVAVSVVGGMLDTNVARWRDQFAERPTPTISRESPDGLDVTVVELEGTFMAMGGGGGKAGTKMLGAILKLPGQDQMLFLKAYGPKATMDHWKPAFLDLIRSLRKR